MGRTSDRVRAALPSLGAAAVSIAWLTTASRHVLGGDNGELATIAVTGGVAHPPGYPLVAIYLHAMRWLPAASPAHASSLANALVALAALLVLTRACRAWRASPASTALACVAWALAPTTWLLATQAEVFAANALFAALLLWLAAPDSRLPAGRRAVALALVAGLALANHYTIATLAPLGVYAYVRAVRASMRPARVVIGSLGALLLGALPYAFLFTASKRALDPASWSWGDVHDGASLFATLARSDYPKSALNSPDHLGGELLRVLTELAGFPLLALAGAALWAARHRGRPSDGAPFASWLALGASIACAGPLFMTVFHVPIEGIGGAVTARFDLLPMTLLVPCIARAIDALTGAWALRSIAPFVATPALFAILAVRGLPAVRAHQRTGVELYAENALLTAPTGAIVLGTGDARLGSFLYARYARGERPDVAFVNARLLLAPWYHARIERVLGVALPEPREESLDVTAVLDALLATGRPIFVTDWFAPHALEPFASYPIGPLIRIAPRGEAVPAPDDVEHANLALSARLKREPLPLAGPEPWSDALAEDYVRPWRALAQSFAQQGDGARAEANARRAEETRAALAWP